MRSNSLFRGVFILLCACLLAACGGGNTAAASAETYFKTLVSKDANRLSTLSCAAWEPQARLELDAFQAVAVTLEGLSCQEKGVEGKNTLVTCQGQIVATYNTEKQNFPISDRTYLMVQEGGEWRMCGTK